jgi:hypothetical protein
MCHFSHRFIPRFRHPSLFMGEAAYFYMHLVSALTYIENVDPATLVLADKSGAPQPAAADTSPVLSNSGAIVAPLDLGVTMSCASNTAALVDSALAPNVNGTPSWSPIPVVPVSPLQSGAVELIHPLPVVGAAMVPRTSTPPSVPLVASSLATTASASSLASVFTYPLDGSALAAETLRSPVLGKSDDSAFGVFQAGEQSAATALPTPVVIPDSELFPSTCQSLLEVPAAATRSRASSHEQSLPPLHSEKRLAHSDVVAPTPSRPLVQSQYDLLGLYAQNSAPPHWKSASGTTLSNASSRTDSPFMPLVYPAVPNSITITPNPPQDTAAAAHRSTLEVAATLSPMDLLQWVSQSVSLGSSGNSSRANSPSRPQGSNNAGRTLQVADILTALAQSSGPHQSYPHSGSGNRSGNATPPVGGLSHQSSPPHLLPHNNVTSNMMDRPDLLAKAKAAAAVASAFSAASSASGFGSPPPHVPTYRHSPVGANSSSNSAPTAASSTTSSLRTSSRPSSLPNSRRASLNSATASTSGHGSTLTIPSTQHHESPTRTPTADRDSPSVYLDDVSEAVPRVPFLPEELDALQFRFLKASADDLRLGDLPVLLAEYKYMAKLLHRLKRVVGSPP